MGIKVYSPSTLEELASLLPKEGGKVLAGGTDLIIALQKELVKPQFLMNLGNIDELKKLTFDDNCIKLGSMVNFTQLVQDEYIKTNIPSLWEAARKMGAVQIQNRATIGGNICNAAPAADSIPVFMSLQAECLVFGIKGRRTVPISSFVIDRGKNSLEKGEILEAVVFNKPDINTGCGFAKLGKRNALAISTISCAVVIEEEKGRIEKAVVYTGSLGAKAERESATEEYLLGRDMDSLDLQKASEVLSGEVEQRLGSRASIAYKKEAVKGIFVEAVAKAKEHLYAKKGGA